MAARRRPQTPSAALYFYLAATLMLLGTLAGIVFEPEIRFLALGCDGGPAHGARHDDPAVIFPADSVPGGGPPGGDVVSITVDPRRPGTVYAVTVRGVFKSVNGGTSWNSVGRFPDRSTMPSITVDPSDSSRLFMPVKYGEVFATTNGGESWQRAGAASRQEKPSTRLLYAWNHETGVFKSTDFGASWAAVNHGLTSKTVHALAIDPSDTNVIYAGCIQGGGVFKSTDGGGTWFPARSGLDATETILLAPARDAATLYAASGGEVFAYRGDRWSQIASVWDVLGGEVVSALAVDPAARATIYVATRNDNGSSRPARIFRSTNGGATWSAADAGVRMGRFGNLGGVRDLAVDPSGAVWTQADGVFTSHDSGRSWTEVQRNNARLEVSHMALDPTRSGTVYLYRFDHFLKLTNRGTAWEFADQDLPHYQGGDSACLGPLAKNALAISSVVVHPTAPNVLYASGTYLPNVKERHALFRSTDHGASWVPLASGLGRMGLMSLAIDPEEPRTLLGSTGGSVLRSADQGITWSNTAGLPASSGIHGIVFNAARRGTVYASTTSGVFVSDDAGVTWRPTDSR